MKRTILATLLVLLSFKSHSADLASYRFATLDQESDQAIVKVLEVTVDEERLLKVKMSKATGESPFFIGGNVETTTHEKVLNRAVFDSLKTRVVAIANAPIIKKIDLIVCELFAGPLLSNDHLSVARDYDFESKTFNGDIELVSGPQGCWVMNKVMLENERARQQALSLKEALRTLGLDFVGNI